MINLESVIHAILAQGISFRINELEGKVDGQSHYEINLVKVIGEKVFTSRAVAVHLETLVYALNDAHDEINSSLRAGTL